MNLTLTGAAQAILKNLAEVMKNADTQQKITVPGFLRLLLENNAMVTINNLAELRAGQSRTVKVAYQQRGLESSVSGDDDCATSIVPEWKNTSISSTTFKKIGILFTDDQMRTLTMDATAAAGNGLNKAMMETLFTKINALVQAMDTALVSAQASAFGKNIAYAGTAAGAAQNIALGERTHMDDGLVRLMTDMTENEVNPEDFLICGAGRILSYDAYQKTKQGVDAGGIGSLGMKVYPDFKTTSSWGSNNFGVFERGAVGLVEWNKNVGVYAGEKGDSVFFTIPMPLTFSDGSKATIVFDAQLRYRTCPTTSGDTTVGRGYELIISKNFALFNVPSDAYASGDRLNGVNGTFLYAAVEPANETVNVTPASGAEFTIAPTEDAVFKTQEVTEP